MLTAMHRRPERRQQHAQTLVDDLEHLDELDLGRFDVTRDGPMPEDVGGSETKAMVRVALATMLGFTGLVAIVIALSVALH